MPICSIIILNYKGEKIIGKTIESLSQLSYPKDRFEIIIVDNNSRDKSGEIIDSFVKRLSTNDFRFMTIYLKDNLGFAGGNNEGIKKAKGEYVVLLNNDCIVDKEWLSELMKVAEKDKKILAVGSKVYLQQTNKIQNAGIMMFNDGYGRDVGAVVTGHSQDFAEDRGQFDKEKETYAACGVAVLYRRSILNTIGFLDDSFFLYYEDVELSERAHMNGYKIMYAPKAVVYHAHAASSKEWSAFFIFHSELGRLLHVFFWFPHRIFWKEYIKFKFKAMLRIPYGIKRRKLTQQAQYFKVVLYIFLHLPQLYIKRAEKLRNISGQKIEENLVGIFEV